MLNRIFIAIGILTILVIAAAFLVPRVIPWGNFRDRMQVAASEALGAQVTIKGDIAFQLLPQPLLTFNDLAVGPPERPSLTVAHVQAELSLLDFLRDRYSITKLLLEEPELTVSIGADGALSAPIMGGSTGFASNVAIENANLRAGTILIADARSTKTIRLDGISGVIELPGRGAPFSFQGSGLLGGGVYDVRLTSTPPGDTGKTQLALFVARGDQSSSLSAEGLLTFADHPTFKGNLTLRSRPPAGNKDLVRGDFVVTSTVEAGLDRVVLPAYTILPDENRAGTRLTGAADLSLGPDAKFNAVISGGVLALPPRDATAEDAVAPYELVRLLGELPAPPLTSVPGRIGVDIAEIDLRALALRNVRFDAESGANGWTIKNFTSVLPGNSTLKVEGVLSAAGARPHFTGSAALETSRLDALAQLWRKPSAPNPLFNRKGTLTAAVDLDDDALRLSNGKATVAGGSADLDVTINFGETRRVDVVANAGALDDEASAAVAAMLPELSANSGFGVTFPKGSLSVKAAEASVLGLPGRGLALDGAWEGGVLELKSASAEDLGGARFGLGLTVFGTAARPEMFGQGSLAISSGEAPALARLFDAFETPAAVREVLVRSAPADLQLELQTPGGDGSQILKATGTAGTATLAAEATLAQGFARAVGSPVKLALDMKSSDAAAMSAQVGLMSPDFLSPDGPMHLTLVLDASAAGSLVTNALLESGPDSIGFDGSIATADPERWTGSGTLHANLSDPSVLAEQLGAGGISLPAVKGSAQLGFAGRERIDLTGIEAESGGQPIHGELMLVGQDGAGAVTGTLGLGPVSLEAMAATLVGPAALISSGSSVWPDGPIAVQGGPRQTTGRVRIESASVTAGGAPLVSDASFDLAWDANAVRIGELSGTLGGGKVTFDASVCCSGSTGDKTLTARIGVEGTAITAVLPPAAGKWLGGTLSGAAQVQGTGDSLAAVIDSLAGEGSFTVDDFTVAGLASSAFGAVASREDVGDVQPDVLAGDIQRTLESGPFAAPEVAGSFTVAGGTVRNANLAVEGKDVRLFGGGTLRLSDLALEGNYTLSPVGSLGADGYINETTAQVTARLGGTLLDPQRTFDVNGLVDAIQVHAYEVKLAELERLRAEDEARVKAAAEERARKATEAKAAKDAETERASVASAMDVISASREAILTSTRSAGEAAQAAAEQKAQSIAEAEAAAEEAAARARRAAAQPAPAASAPVAPLQPLVLTPSEPDSRF